MKVIWKYTLEEHVNDLALPKGYEILSVVEQHNNITLYCLVNPEEEKEDVQFLMVGTGWNIPDGASDDMKFIGTVLTTNGLLVWHVFKSNGESLME